MTSDENLSGLTPHATPRVSTATDDSMLKSDSILIAEFTYASASAHEAVDDRARLFDRYLLIFGGVFVSGATAIYQLNQAGANNFIQPLAIVAFFFMGALGFAFLRTFVRIRQAFVDSMMVMSRIKEYYIHYLRNEAPHLDLAFKWRLATVPEKDRRFTVSYLMAHTVATLDSVSFGLSALVFIEARQNHNNGDLLSLPHNPIPYLIAGVVIALALASQLAYYRNASRGKTHDEKVEWLDKLRAG